MNGHRRVFVCYLRGAGGDGGPTGVAGLTLENGGGWFSVDVPRGPLNSGALIREGGRNDPRLLLFEEAPPVSVAADDATARSARLWLREWDVPGVHDDLLGGRDVWVEVVAGDHTLRGKLREFPGARGDAGRGVEQEGQRSRKKGAQELASDRREATGVLDRP